MKSPRLLALAIHPRSAAGLEFPTQTFGEFLTVLRGENGSGKTAIMCSLYWALGGSRKPDEPLWSRCSEVELVLQSAGGHRTTVRRQFTTDLNASIEFDGKRNEFDEEKSFSAALRIVLGIPDREWTGTKGGIASPYMSILLPAFAVDQDSGWNKPYAPYEGRRFVKDQEEEVGRLLMGLDPRHDAARDEVRRKLVQKRDVLRAEVDVRTHSIDALAAEVSRVEGRDLDELRASKDRLQQELSSFDGVVTAFAEADAGLTARVDDARRERDSASRELAHARHKLGALQRLMQKTDGDLDIVASNETAAQTFRRFCANPSCEFFVGAAKNPTYGRRVLYLRDQLKDLQTAMKAAGGQVETLEKQVASADARLKRFRTEYENLSQASPAAKISGAMDAVSKELARVSGGIALREQLGKAEAERADLLGQIDALEQSIEDHDAASKKRTARVREVKDSLQKAVNRWLGVLRTNKDVTVGINDDLRVTIRDDVISDQAGPSGSSRLRVVLAFHAARLEVALSRTAHHPGFLLFDAPRQHEIDPQDFESYFGELRTLAEKYPDRVQVVASSRTPIPTAKGDKEWSPSFPPGEGDEHPWFLGPPVGGQGNN